jgi:hypothetical protein
MWDKVRMFPRRGLPIVATGIGLVFLGYISPALVVLGAIVASLVFGATIQRDAFLISALLYLPAGLLGVVIGLSDSLATALAAIAMTIVGWLFDGLFAWIGIQIGRSRVAPTQ